MITVYSGSIITCNGTITGAGFETPEEVLYLGKKLLYISIKGQCEQKCNGAALNDFKVPVIKAISPNFYQTVINRLHSQSRNRLS